MVDNDRVERKGPCKVVIYLVRGTRLNGTRFRRRLDC